IFTVNVSIDLAVRALRAGASGILSKEVSIENLARALRGVADGEAAISRSMMMRLIEKLREMPDDYAGMRPVKSALTGREWEVLTRMQHGDHPRFFARVPSPSNGVSALGDALAAGFNAFAGSWAGGSGPAALELVVLDWLRELCGLAPGTEGILVSGGSVAA